MKNTQHCISFQ